MGEPEYASQRHMSEAFPWGAPDDQASRPPGNPPNGVTRRSATTRDRCHAGTATGTTPRMNQRPDQRA